MQVGAFDAFGMNRRELLWQLGLLYRPPSAQMALPLPIEQDLRALEDMSTWDQMTADYRLLSLSPGYHPMALIRPYIGESMPSLRHLLEDARRRARARARHGRLPPAARHRQGLRLPAAGGRVRHAQRHRAAVAARTSARDGPRRGLRHHRGRAATQGRHRQPPRRHFEKLPVPHAMQAPESHNFG